MTSLSGKESWNVAPSGTFSYGIWWAKPLQASTSTRKCYISLKSKYAVGLTRKKGKSIEVWNNDGSKARRRIIFNHSGPGIGGHGDQSLSWALIARGFISRDNAGDEVIRSRIWESYTKLWSSRKEKSPYSQRAIISVKSGYKIPTLLPRSLAKKVVSTWSSGREKTPLRNQNTSRPCRAWVWCQKVQSSCMMEEHVNIEIGPEPWYPPWGRS